MGFPLGYSELFLPKLLLHMVFLLGFLRRLISWAFTFMGLGDLLLDPVDGPSPHHHTGTPFTYINIQSPNQYHQYPEFPSVSALLIQEILPVVKFCNIPTSLNADTCCSCAVCLYELEGDDEVRSLSNCRHVFHRCCLDRWMEHDQHTCPLCRSPLIPEEMQGAFSDRMWAAAGLPDSFGVDDFSY